MDQKSNEARLAKMLTAISLQERTESASVERQYAMANVALIELLLGRPEAALEHGRAAIAQIDALGAGGTTGHGRGHLYWAVMIALILLNRPAEGPPRRSSLDAWRRGVKGLFRQQRP